MLEQYEITMRSTNIDVIYDYGIWPRLLNAIVPKILFSLIPGLYVALRRVSDHLENRHQKVVPFVVAS